MCHVKAGVTSKSRSKQQWRCTATKFVLGAAASAVVIVHWQRGTSRTLVCAGANYHPVTGAAPGALPVGVLKQMRSPAKACVKGMTMLLCREVCICCQL
eukprot:1926374-Amphidinium_carterae.1